MALEIERKFLVKSNAFEKEAFDRIWIHQGFISTDPNKLVRIRISGDHGWLTIKGSPDDAGLSRMEWQKEIGIEEAKQLMQLCGDRTMEKIRYLIRSGKHIFEVDVFSGKNEGLIIAELELEYADEPYEKPVWLGEEVTGDPKYFNVMLVNFPYVHWSD